MSSDYRFWIVVLIALAVSCTPYRKIQKIRSGEVGVELAVSDEKPCEDAAEPDEEEISLIKGSLSEGPVIMNAIRDTETGDMIATDVISASKVTARFRNVAERAGLVTVSFDITVPAGLADSRWQLKIRPFLEIMDEVTGLEPIYITGSDYRAAQLRGYQRYRNFLSSIIRDTTDFIRMGQLEIFIERHFPDTYRMKNDSSIIPEPLAGNLFGVTQTDALLHYTRKLMLRHNERRKGREGKMFAKYVKDPIVTDGIRLDTVIAGMDGDFIYRYSQTFRSRPALKKVRVSLEGSLYEMGECIMCLPFPQDLTFYISSLSSLADNRPKYRMIVKERVVHDNTRAFIDFSQGSAVIDTCLGDNASELRRIRRCFDDVASMDGLVADSIVIVASCSPEGSYVSNRKLSEDRADAVLKHVSGFVPDEWKSILRSSGLPENWEQLMRLVENDTVIAPDSRKRILELGADLRDPDAAESKMSRMHEYRYLRERLYPKLRSVRFDFYLHRTGMAKDTVHTAELDTLYLRGVQALRDLDYKTAVGILRPYDDYNAALAFVSADYNHSALDVLGRLGDSEPKVCYLKALVLSRLGQEDEAMKYLELSIAYDAHMEHRANLDPEMCILVKKRQTNNKIE